MITWRLTRCWCDINFSKRCLQNNNPRVKSGIYDHQVTEVAHTTVKKAHMIVRIGHRITRLANYSATVRPRQSFSSDISYTRDAKLPRQTPVTAEPGQDKRCSGWMTGCQVECLEDQNQETIFTLNNGTTQETTWKLPPTWGASHLQPNPHLLSTCMFPGLS